MLSAILIDKNNEPLRFIKQVHNFFVSDRAFDYATGELVLSISDRRDNNLLYQTRVIFMVGNGMNRHFMVNKVTTDNSGRFPKLTFDLCGIEYLMNQRNEEDKILSWENATPLAVCADLVGRIQNGNDGRSFPQLSDEAITSGTMDNLELVQMSGGNVWDFIQAHMEAYEFCCDAMTVSFGVSQLRFRKPDDLDSVILSDLDRRVRLEYINLDYSEIRNYIIVGGEGEGIRKKYSSYDEGETGIDRFENYADVTISSDNGYISNDDYYKLLQEAAESMHVEKKLETDYIVPEAIFDRVKTGDTVYTSSAAVNDGRLEPRIVNELKLSVENGVTYRYVTLK